MTTTEKSKAPARSRIFGWIAVVTLSLAVLAFVWTLATRSGDVLATVLLALIGLGAGAVWQRDRRLAKDAEEERPPLGQQSAWPTFLRTANLYERILCLGGAGALVMGAIVGFSASGAGRDEKNANELLVMIGGFEFYDSSAGQSFLGLMWFGVILAVLGAVLLVTFVATRAAKSNKIA